MARAGFAGRRRKSVPEHLNSSGTWGFGLEGGCLRGRAPFGVELVLYFAADDGFKKRKLFFVKRLCYSSQENFIDVNLPHPVFQIST